MKSDAPQPDDSQLDAYLDGTLDPEAARSFESTFPDPETLQAEVALQRDVDESLRRHFVVPQPPPELFDAVKKAAAGAVPIGRRHASLVLRVVRSAAAVVVTVALWLFLVYYQWFQEPRSVSAEPANSSSVSDIYNSLVNRGFQPDEVAQTGQQLAKTVLWRHGQAVDVDPLPEDVRLLGFAYLNEMKNTTTVLMCRVDDQPVLVFVGHRRLQFGPERFRDPLRVNAFGWNYGHLWALEITPLSEPRIINLLAPHTPPQGSKSIQTTAGRDKSRLGTTVTAPVTPANASIP